MDDNDLVDILHIADSFQVDAHSSLVQRLVTEGWRRLQRLDLLSLSTFAACLRRQNMTTSPLMGQIASIVDSTLDDLDDPVTLSSFLCSLYAVSSPRLQERLMGKTESSIEKMDTSYFETALQLTDILSKDKSILSLMKKCDRFFQENVSAIDSQTICNIMRVYQSQHFTNCEFNVAAKARLMKEVDRCDHPDCFAELFVILSPIASLTTRERLETKLASYADQMSLINLQDVLNIMAVTKSTSTALIQKICSRLWKHLGVCSSDQLCSIAETVMLLGSQDSGLQTELEMHLKRRMLSSFIPSNVAQMMAAMSFLNPYQIDEVVISKLYDNLAQCNFLDLSRVTSAVIHVLQSTDTAHRRNVWKLLTATNNLRLKKVKKAKCLDSLLLEMKDKEGTSRMEMELVEATLNTFQRLIDQLSWKNVTQVSVLVLRMNTQCPALQDKIAMVVMDNLDKIDEVVISKLYDNLAQCNFLDLSRVTSAVIHVLQSTDTAHRRNVWKLLTATNNLRLKKVKKAKCLDSLLLEMKDKEGTSRMEMELVEATLNTFQRLIDQLSWKNVTQVSVLVLRMNTQCPALQDKIAMVVMDNLDKVAERVLRVESSASSDIAAHDALSPHFLVMTTYIFAVAGYFQEELIKATFNTNFLHRFDAQMDAFNPSISKKSHFYLMELNRAICIEHPEYGVPWFHEQYCQQTQHRNIEYILDKEGNPIAYVENDVLSSDSSMSDHDSQLQENEPLPAGAQRFAVDFLHHGACLRNTLHLKGSPEMKKRHLEILGYRVIQVEIELWACFRNSSECQY
ncbi:PREDICTED: FAST kinase domain-containing protein 1, mitochondrial-like [Nanorana parkeri]|uniref:FAST kinase domain-containing protein 1, mitochondrial-like n=1 Tax=Nanorana parkeri TaxID=125878 RepID=UPI000854F363|nr:PREDICTED: FAST kinase domain-containing protein 1, mitochondrial-like [Nanorana parkeri]